MPNQNEDIIREPTEIEILKVISMQLAEQNRMLNALATVIVGQHQDKLKKLHEWQKTHRATSKRCAAAAEILNKSQMELVENIALEITGDPETLENEFGMQELLDKFGNKLGQLNMLLQVLGTLGNEVSIGGPPDCTV